MTDKLTPVLGLVFGFMSPRAVSLARQVCKLWRSKRAHWEEAHSACLALCEQSQVRDLFLEPRHQPCDQPCDQDLSLFTNLDSLTCPRWPRSLPHLQRLEVYRPGAEKVAEKPVGRLPPGLKNLTIESLGFVTRGALVAARITALGICKKPSSQKWLAVLSPRLTELRLGKHFPLGDAGLALVVGSCPNLAILRIARGNLTAPGVSCLTQAARLRDLALPEATKNVGNAAIVALAKSSKLERLDLRQAYVLQPRVPGPVSWTHKLRTLAVGCLDQMTLRWVASLVNLETLILARVWTILCLRALEPLTRLRTLRVQGAAHLASFDGSFASLRFVDLECPRCCSNSIAWLSRLQTLHELRLSKADDDCIVALSQLSQLRGLEVSDASAVTGAGLASLARFSELRRLELVNLDFEKHDKETDLWFLACLTRLECLRLELCPFSLASLRRLFDSLPNLSDLDCPPLLSQKFF